MKRSLGGATAAALAAVALAATATPASAAIVVSDLGALPGHSYSEAFAVRDDGVAVGHSMSVDGYRRAVVFDSSGVTELATPGRHSQAYDIDDSGLVVGSAEAATVQVRLPVWWDGGGALHELPGFINGEAMAVNEAGVIVGTSDTDRGHGAVRWEDTTTDGVRLPALPGGADDSAAHDVNDDGVAVGYSRGADGVRHAVVWDTPGAVHQLDTPAGYPQCSAERLNDTGTIIGSCLSGSAGVAVRWDPAGAATVLPTLGGAFVDPVGVSDAGTIVGVAEDTDGRHHPVRWNANGTITKLASLGGTHGVAIDINDNGTIVGRTQTAGGEFHATRWRNAG